MKTTAIFDLDGTLLYTLEDLTDSVNFALQNFNYPQRTDQEIRSFVGNGVKKLIELSVPANTSDEIIINCLEIFKNHYKNNMYNKTCPYDGINELLDKLRQKNIKTAVVSNKFDKAVKELCRYYFKDKIDIAVGENQSIKKKPSPEGVLSVIEKLGEDIQNCVYIGDSEVDILTAQNAGMDIISVDWGYKDKDFLFNNGAKIVVSNCDTLFDEILK